MATSGSANKVLFTGDVVLADARAANTVTDLDFPNQSGWEMAQEYAIVVRNPGPSALTVVARNQEAFGGTNYYPEVQRWTVAANTVVVLAVRAAWGMGDGSRISVSNDALIGAGTGYTVNVRVRQGA